MREILIIWFAMLLVCCSVSEQHGVQSCDTDTDCMIKNPNVEPY